MTITSRQSQAAVEAEMLPQQPPPRVTTWMAWLFIALFIAITLAAVLVHIPETVRCPFVVVPENGADPVQSPILSVIQAVQISEGQSVAEGAELFVLRSDEIRGWQTQLQSAQEDARALQKRTAKLEEFFAEDVAIKDKELKQVEKNVSFREKHLATSRDFLARNEKLASEKLVSEVELLQYRLQVAESEKDLNAAQRSVEQVNLQRQQIETERARQRTEEEAEAEKLKVRIAALERQLQNCADGLMTIKAPYRAVVLSLAHRNAGTVVLQGGELCQLARVDSRLGARLKLQESGLPRLVPGQKVRLFFDAFPYQRYGTLTGRLEWISPAVITTSEGAAFSAAATLDQAAFSGKGQNQPLRAGMRGEARISVGSRTMVEYLFEPIYQLREEARR
jgi:multidrug efflux pump subunit AcrA (membrane-fusion protein)